MVAANYFSVNCVAWEGEEPPQDSMVALVTEHVEVLLVNVAAGTGRISVVRGVEL